MNLTRVHIRVRLRDRTITSAADEHLAVAGHEARWLPAADVIICSEPSRRPAEDVHALLAAYPGSLVVAVGAPDGGCVVGTRDGQLSVFRGADPATLGSIAHAWTLSGGRLDELRGALIRATITRSAPPASPGPLRPAARRDRRRSPAPG
ncbi:hypothetical protein AB0K60_20775 [Thermopolyspora sp. NPDC052614]|uniref:hypothetical protein n=1 Tax=Thermopolyspora sp. NPDC052614 TaxID=3155682 RepID=UPI0034205BA5